MRDRYFSCFGSETVSCKKAFKESKLLGCSLSKSWYKQPGFHISGYSTDSVLTKWLFQKSRWESYTAHTHNVSGLLTLLKAIYQNDSVTRPVFVLLWVHIVSILSVLSHANFLLEVTLVIQSALCHSVCFCSMCHGTEIYSRQPWWSWSSAVFLDVTCHRMCAVRIVPPPLEKKNNPVTYSFVLKAWSVNPVKPRSQLKELPPTLVCQQLLASHPWHSCRRNKRAFPPISSRLDRRDFLPHSEKHTSWTLKLVFYLISTIYSNLYGREMPYSRP